MSRHLHLMGVGGVGMCGLAEVLLGSGYVVSGCDLASSERTLRLEDLGVRVMEGHDPAHVADADAVVVSAAVDGSSPELAAARERGLPVVRRSEMLGELMRGRRGVAVAGTHGKTTTTALVGHLLAAAGLDPTVVVGGWARDLGGHARLGGGDVLVCEADEYDRAFLQLGPEVAVVTTLEPEHLDCYRDVEDLTATFAAFANRCSAFGTVVLNGDDAGASSLLPLLRRRVVTYGLGGEARVQAADLVAEGAGSSFRITVGGRSLGSVRLPLAGRHNVSNALAALAVGFELGVPFPALADACAGFSGVGRRFEVRHGRRGMTVVDDYAHHPTELRATIAAVRQAFGGRRLVAVFQPHLFSRTRDFAAGFGDALLGADVAIVLPVYPAREAPLPGVSSDLVVVAARRGGHPQVLAAADLEDAVALVDELAETGDVVLTLGAGDVWQVAERLLEEAS